MKKVEIYLKEILVKENGIEDKKQKGSNYVGFSWDKPRFNVESADAVRKVDLKDGVPFKFPKTKRLKERRLFREECEGETEISIKISSKVSLSKFEKIAFKVLRTTGEAIVSSALPDIAADAAKAAIKGIFEDPEDKEYAIGETYVVINEASLPASGNFPIAVLQLDVENAITKDIATKKPGRQPRGKKYNWTTETILPAGPNGSVLLYGNVIP